MPVWGMEIVGDLGTGNNTTTDHEKRTDNIKNVIAFFSFSGYRLKDKCQTLFIYFRLFNDFSNASDVRSLRYIKTLCGTFQGGNLIRVSLTGASCYSK